MSSAIKCVHEHDAFCFVCGQYIYARSTRTRSGQSKTVQIKGKKLVEGYRNYFKRDPEERNIDWSPSVSCRTCYNKLTSCTKKMDIELPAIWLEPQNHPHDCYFCQFVIPKGVNSRKRLAIAYPEVTSVKKAKLYSTAEMTEAENVSDEPMDMSTSQDFADIDDVGGSFPIASGSSHVTENVSAEDAMFVDPQQVFNIRGSTASQTSNLRTSTSSTASASTVISTYKPHSSHYRRQFRQLQPETPKKIIKMTQARLNDMVRDMDLSKASAEFLASHLKDMGVLSEGKSLYLSLYGPRLCMCVCV